MYHLRIVAPPERSEETLSLLTAAPSVCNVLFLEGAAQEPRGDVIMADVAQGFVPNLAERQASAHLGQLGVAGQAEQLGEEVVRVRWHGGSAGGW